MAFQNATGPVSRSPYNGGARTTAPAVVGNTVAKTFEKDPNEVGIGYSKEMKAGGSFVAITVLSDIPAGTKLALFENNKVQNRTAKTPTHKLKISTGGKKA